MTPRQDVARVTEAAERDLDALCVPAARAVGLAVRRWMAHTPDGPRVTPLARAAILRDVDRALDLLYPRTRGAGSPAEAVVVGRKAQAAAAPVAAAVEDARRRLADEPALLAAIGDADGPIGPRR